MKSSQHFDAIVLGVGSMGIATCYELAKRGLRVLGIEQFDILNNKSSHSGHTRIIRKAYFEHPDYVPLLERAYHQWNELETLSGNKIYHQTGLLYLDQKDGEVNSGVLKSSKLYNIEVAEWNPSILKNRFPGLEIIDGLQMLFEPNAGYLDVHQAFASYQKLASQYGAVLHSNEKVLKWNHVGDSIEVITGKANYSCDRLIITAGPWSSPWLPSQVKLKITRQVLSWITVPEEIQPLDLPCWLMTRPDGKGAYYGFPYSDHTESPGYKIGWHYPDQNVNPNEPIETPTEEEREEFLNQMQQLVPNAKLSHHQSLTCLYTNTEDEDFVIDTLPDTDGKVIFAAGFSGHGFKFVSVIGELLADLVTNDSSKLPWEFLRASRFE